MPEALQSIGIDQKLGDRLPMDAEFKNEDGKMVKLGDYFTKGKPVIIAFVYYECPMLCNHVLNGLSGALKGINLVAGLSTWPPRQQGSIISGTKSRISLLTWAA